MKILKVIVACCSLVLLTLAAMTAGALDDIATQRDCAHCGMDRKVYGYSRMLVEYSDGARVGLCSLHCAATELEANKGRPVKALLVADRESRTLIEADKAIWVMGGNKRGVMTQQPKWAFASADAARQFVKENGGRVTAWPEALKAATEELSKSR